LLYFLAGFNTLFAEQQRHLKANKSMRARPESVPQPGWGATQLPVTGKCKPLFTGIARGVHCGHHLPKVSNSGQYPNLRLPHADLNPVAVPSTLIHPFPPYPTNSPRRASCADLNSASPASSRTSQHWFAHRDNAEPKSSWGTSPSSASPRYAFPAPLT